MLHVLPERKHYRTYKQERTPDFSDLRNKIAEVEGEKNPEPLTPTLTPTL